MIAVDRALRLAPHIGLAELVDLGRSDRQHRWALLTPERLVSLTQLAGVLERLRAAVGSRPIRITSGLRERGARASQHEVGQAADIQIDGMSPIEVMTALADIEHELDVRLRQVIAESEHGEAGLRQPMAAGSGRWVHVAILGPDYGSTSRAWLTWPGSGPYIDWRREAA